MVSKVVFCLVALMNIIFGCKAFTEVYSIVKDSSDNTYYVGNIDSNYFIGKRNAGCEIQWVSSQGSTSGDDDNDQNTEILYDVSVGFDGLIYTVGSTRGNFSEPSAEAPNLDAAVIVYNPSNGNVILQKQYDIEENLDNIARAVTQKSDGNLLVGVIGSIPNVAISAVYTTRILEIDSSSLEVIKIYTIEVATTEIFLSLQGGPVLIDIIYDESSNSVVALSNILGRGILFRYSLDSESVISQIEWGTLLGSNQISGLTSDENGGFYVVGSSSSNVLNNNDMLDDGNSTSEFHAYVIKFSNSEDDSLSATWVRQLSSSGSSQSGNDITIDPVTGEIVVIGSFTADFAITDSQTGLSFELDNVKDDGLTDVFIWYLSASSGDYSDLRRSSIASTDAEDQGNVVEVLSSRLLEIGGVIDDGSEGNPIVCDSSNLLMSPSASPAGSPSPTPSSTQSPDASQSMMIILTASPVASEAQVPMPSVASTSPSPSLSSSMPISSQMSIFPTPTLPGEISDISPSPGSSQAIESPPPSASSTLSGNPISPAPSPSELVSEPSVSPSSIFIDLEIATPISSAVVTPSIFTPSVSPQATRISFVSATPSATGQLASITQENAQSTVELITEMPTVPIFFDQIQETTMEESISGNPFQSNIVSIDGLDEGTTPESSSTFSPLNDEDESIVITVPRFSNSMSIEPSQPAQISIDMEALNSLSFSPDVADISADNEDIFIYTTLNPSTDGMINLLDEEFTPEVLITLLALEPSKPPTSTNDEDASIAVTSGVPETTIPTEFSNPMNIVFSSSTPSPSSILMEIGESMSSLNPSSSPVLESPQVTVDETFFNQPIASIEIISSMTPIFDDPDRDGFKLQPSSTAEPFSVFPDESFELNMEFSSPEEFLDDGSTDPVQSELVLPSTTPFANISTVGPIAMSPSISPEIITMIPQMSFSVAPDFDFFDETPFPEMTIVMATVRAIETISDFPMVLFPSDASLQDSPSPSKMPLVSEEDKVETSGTEFSPAITPTSSEDFLFFDISTSPVIDSSQLPILELSPIESTKPLPIETDVFENVAATESDESQAIEVSQLPLPDITFSQSAEFVLPSEDADLTATEESTSQMGPETTADDFPSRFSPTDDNMSTESLTPNPTIDSSPQASKSPISSPTFSVPSTIGPKQSLGPISTPGSDNELGLFATEEVSPEIESDEAISNVTSSVMPEPSNDISSSFKDNDLLTPTADDGTEQSSTIDIVESLESPVDRDELLIISESITPAPTEEILSSASPYEDSLGDSSEITEDPTATEEMFSFSDEPMFTPTNEEIISNDPEESSFSDLEASEVPLETEQTFFLDDTIFSTPTDEIDLMFSPELSSSDTLFQVSSSPQIVENVSFPPTSNVSPTLTVEKDFSVGPQQPSPSSTPEASSLPLSTVTPSPSALPTNSAFPRPSESAFLSVTATFSPSLDDTSPAPFESSSPSVSTSNIAAIVTDVIFTSASPSSSPQPIASFDGSATPDTSMRPTPMGLVETPNTSPEQSSMLQSPVSIETDEAQPIISGTESTEPSFIPEETLDSELSQPPLLISASPIITELTSMTITPDAFTSEMPLPPVLESSTPSSSMSLSMPLPSQGDRELPTTSSVATPSVLPSVSSFEMTPTPFQIPDVSVTPSKSISLSESPNPSEAISSISPTETPIPEISFILQTITPSLSPTMSPFMAPVMTSSTSPTVTLSMSPTVTSSMSPTMTPSTSPTATSFMSPTVTLSMSPTVTSSMSPTMTSSTSPTATSFISPTVTLSVSPTVTSSMSPTMTSSTSPTATSSMSPTVTLSISPTVTSSMSPTMTSSMLPTMTPTVSPTVTLSVSPTITPSVSPMTITSVLPTRSPSVQPTISPTVSPITRVSPEASLVVRPTVTPSPLRTFPVQATITPTPSSLQTNPLASVSPTITPVPSAGPNVPTPSVIATPISSFAGEIESPTPNTTDFSTEPSLMASESLEEPIEMPTESSSPEESMELECEVGPEQHNVDEFETTNNFQRVLITIQIAGARLLEVCQLRKETAQRFIELSAANTQSEQELWFITSLTDGPAIIKRDFDLIVIGNDTGLEPVSVLETPSPSPTPDRRPNLLFPGSVLINVTTYMQSPSAQLVTGPYLDYVNSQNIVRVMFNEGFREIGYAEVFALPMIIDEKQTVPQIETATSDGSAVVAILSTIGVTTIAAIAFITFQLAGRSGSPMGSILPV